MHKVAISEGFKNYKFNVNHGSAVGDGFVGVMIKVQIEENESEKQLAIVLKCPPDNPAKRKEFGAMELFKREVHLYNKVLPEFNKFQEEKKIKESTKFTQFPKFYFAEFDELKDEAIIIMEGLKEIEFKMWDKYVPINYDHAKLVLEALERLHAISFALKAQQPQKFEKFKGLSDFMTTHLSESNFYKIMTAAISRAAETLDEADVEIRKRVLSLNDDFSGLMKELVNPDLAEPYTVATHADCWTNNFMFTTKLVFLLSVKFLVILDFFFAFQSDVPDKVVLLDWQVSRY